MKNHTQAPLLIEGAYLHVSCGGLPGYRVAYGCGDGPHQTWVADRERIRDTWNACVGLELPADVPPGILAELVALVRRTALAFREFNFTEDAGKRAAIADTLKDCYGEAVRLLNGLGALKPDAAPVPSPGDPECPQCLSRHTRCISTQEEATWGEIEFECNACGKRFLQDLHETPAPQAAVPPVTPEEARDAWHVIANSLPMVTPDYLQKNPGEARRREGLNRVLCMLAAIKDNRPPVSPP